MGTRCEICDSEKLQRHGIAIIDMDSSDVRLTQVKGKSAHKVVGSP